GDENRDRRQGIALHQPLEVLILGKAGLLPDLGNRADQQDRVERVQHEEIDEDQEIRRGHERGERAHAANSASAWAGNPSTMRATALASGCGPVSASSNALRPADPKRIRASAARRRTHQSGSPNAALTAGIVPASAIMPMERTACARTAHASSVTSRLSAATDSLC